MSYGLTYNPRGMQQMTHPDTSQLNPTYGNILTYQSPNAVNPFINSATGTYSDFAALTNGLAAQNTAKSAKVDSYNKWRALQLQAMGNDPVRIAAFNKQYPAAFTFNYNLSSGQGVYGPNFDDGLDVNGDPKGGYGLNQKPAKGEAPSTDPYGDYWKKRLGGNFDPRRSFSDGPQKYINKGPSPALPSNDVEPTPIWNDPSEVPQSLRDYVDFGYYGPETLAGSQTPAYH